MDVHPRAPDCSRSVEPRPAAFHTPGHRQWFAVEFISGCAYTLGLRCKPVKPASFRSPCYVTVHAPGGAVIARAPGGAENRCLNTRLTVTATRSGTHYVAVGGGRRGRGTFELNLSEVTRTEAPGEPDGHDARTEATELGDLTDLTRAGFPVTHFHGDSDRDVFFRFSLTDTRRIELDLRIGAAARLSVEDAGGRRLDEADRGKGLSVLLSAGSYFVRVESPQGIHPFMLRYRVRADESADLPDPDTGREEPRQRSGAPTPSLIEVVRALSRIDPSNQHARRLSLGMISEDAPGKGLRRYRLVGGNDAGLFALDPRTGELFFTGSETDLEVGTSQFELSVRVNQAERSEEQTLIVSVTNVPEIPEHDRVADGYTVDRTRFPGARISLGNLTGMDAPGAPLKVRLVAGNESGLFELDESTGELFFTGTPEDLEDSLNRFELTVRVRAFSH